MNNKAPIHFSDYFGIDKNKLNELGVFDPILNFDTKVFVEPLLLKHSLNSIIKASYNNYQRFFSDLLLLLMKSKQIDDKCWRAAKKMVHFPEYQYTCIGYGSGSTEGRGSGIEFNDKILHSAKEIVSLAEGNSEIFLLLPLLEDGIAGDRISDMVQNIIDDDICQYTVKIMDMLGLNANTKHTTRSNNTYNLLCNPYSKIPIKLIPKDILSNLPVANNVDHVIEEMVSYNERLRNVVNRDIGDIWLNTTKSYRKGVLLKELKNNKEFFIETLKALREYKFENYDLDTDYEGLYKWLTDSQSFINVELAKETRVCSDNLESLAFAVTSIIYHFKDIIENKEVWRTFWTKYGSEYRHVKSYYSQMLFFTVCNTWLTSQGSNIKLNLKNDGKHIELEFATSAKNRLIVHIKHANNSTLEKSYKAVLAKYRNTNDERYYYLVMNFKIDDANQLKEIKIIENPICKIFEIDVTQKELGQEYNFVEGAEVDLTETDYGFGNQYLEFEDMDFPNIQYTLERRMGGKKRHEKTDIIKNNIIKPMFANKNLIKGLSTKQRAKKINNELSEVEEMDDSALSNFSTKYGLDICILKNSKECFSDDKEEQIYKWCLAIEKEIT